MLSVAEYMSGKDHQKITFCFPYALRSVQTLFGIGVVNFYHP